MSDAIYCLDIPGSGCTTRLTITVFTLNFVQPCDISEVQRLLPNTHYAKSKALPSVICRPGQPKGSLLVFPRGQLVLVGCSTVQQLTEWVGILDKIRNLAGGIKPLEGPPGHPALPNAQIRNTVFQLQLGCSIDVGKFAARNSNRTKYNPQRFAGCMVLVREDLKVSLFEVGIGNIIGYLPGQTHYVALLAEVVESAKTYNMKPRTRGRGKAMTEEELATLFEEKLRLTDNSSMEEIAAILDKLQLDPSGDDEGGVDLIAQRVKEYEYWQQVVAAENDSRQ